MKNKIRYLISLIAMAIALLFAKAAHGQTNQTSTNAFSQTTNVLSGLGVSPGTLQGVSTTLGFFVDAAPYITNGDCLIEIGALKHGSHYGGLIDVQLPVNTNSWQMTYGVSGAFLDHQLYSGALNVGLGTTINIPVLNRFTGPFYAYVESGPGWNFQKSQLVVQSFAGVKYQHQFSQKWGFVGSYGYGKISDVDGNVQVFTAGATFKF